MNNVRMKYLNFVSLFISLHQTYSKLTGSRNHNFAAFQYLVGIAIFLLVLDTENKFIKEVH